MLAEASPHYSRARVIEGRALQSEGNRPLPSSGPQTELVERMPMNGARIEQVLTTKDPKSTKGRKNFSFNLFFVSFVRSFENAVVGRTKPSPFPLPQKRARVRKKETNPRPFRWERARVRAISSSAGERKLMNHFLVNNGRT
jgi:hypothetical protein